VGLDVVELRFGDELDELRLAAGLSWADLGERSKVSPTYLRDLRSGRRGQRWPSPAIVAAIARGLDVPPERFMLERARLVLANPDAIDYAYNAVIAGQVPT
jgi:transcriptional regulator with XRE-family HTH domain